MSFYGNENMYADTSEHRIFRYIAEALTSSCLFSPPNLFLEKLELPYCLCDLLQTKESKMLCY